MEQYILVVKNSMLFIPMEQLIGLLIQGKIVLLFGHRQQFLQKEQFILGHVSVMVLVEILLLLILMVRRNGENKSVTNGVIHHQLSLKMALFISGHNVRDMGIYMHLDQ
jgi:hypothetical protein